MTSSRRFVAWAFRYIASRYSHAQRAATMYDDRFAEKDQDTLALGSVTGIRYWSVSAPFHDDAGQLCAQLSGARGQWLPGENRAVCLASMGHGPDQIPDRACGCGYWAYWAPDPCGGYAYVKSPDVAGMIEGWGRYRAGTRGFRCLKAKLLAVCVQGAAADAGWRVQCEAALAATYQVPVYSTVETMLKAFPPSRSPQIGSDKHPAFARGGNVFARGGGGGGGGGSIAPGVQAVAATVACRCGTHWGMAPGLFLQCGCGVLWYWDGLTAPQMQLPPSPQSLLKQLDQRRDSP